MRIAAALTASLLALAACGDGDDDAPARAATATGSGGDLDRVVEIAPDRGLYVRCTGTGSPTVVMDALLRAAEIPGPYVLIGTSGGGYITAGFAVAKSTAGRRDGVRGRAAAFPRSAAPDRRGHRPLESREHREARLPASGEGRLERPQADRRYPGHDHQRRSRRGDDQAVAVPVGTAGDAPQRRRPERLARFHPTPQAER